MTIEGELTVRLAWDGRRVARVALHSTRPFAATRLFAGREPAAAAAMVPLLFSVCAQAQGVAAAAATEAALGICAAPATELARRRAAVLETVQEYLWRILVDWPQAMDHPATVEPVAAARRLIAPALVALAPIARRVDGGADAAPPVPLPAARLIELATRHVYGGAPAAWLALMDADAIAGWAARTQTMPARLIDLLLTRAPDLARSDVALMPTATRAALVAHVVPGLRADAAYVQAPLWDRAPAETGALARMHAHPFVAAVRARCGNAVPARFAARLVELAVLLDGLATDAGDEPAAPRVQSIPLAAGEGLGAVETARGLLLHHVVVAAGRVADYRIVAPTEWNFHPAGALVRGLGALAANDEPRLARDARLAVQALDPCVACSVEVVRA